MSHSAASSGREFARAVRSKANVYPTKTAQQKARRAEREALAALRADGWIVAADGGRQRHRFVDEITDLGARDLDGAVRAHVNAEVVEKRREIAARANRLPPHLTKEEYAKQVRTESARSAGWAFRGAQRTRAPELDEDEQ